MVEVLVTGGAGFIGSNFVRYALGAHADWRVTTLDKLTYAGRIENLHDVMDHPRHTFVHGRHLRRGRRRRRSFERSNIVVHFAAETHVDRSIQAAGDFIRTDVDRHVRAARGGARSAPALRAVRADLDRRGLRQRGRRARAARPTSCGRAIPYSASKAGADRLAYSYFATYDVPVDRHARVEQLRAVPVSREGHSALRHQRDRRHPGAALRRRPQRARLAARRRSLPRHRPADRARRRTARSTTSAAATRSRTSTSRTASSTSSAGPRRSSSRLPDRPGHDRRYALDTTKLRSLGWAPRQDFDEGLRRDGRLVPRERVVVAADQRAGSGVPRVLSVAVRRAPELT